MVLIFVFWLRIAKIAKIWTSRKFPAIRYFKSIYTPVAPPVAVERVLKYTMERELMSPDLSTCTVTIPALSRTVMFSGLKVTLGTAWEEEKWAQWVCV